MLYGSGAARSLVGGGREASSQQPSQLQLAEVHLCTALAHISCPNDGSHEVGLNSWSTRWASLPLCTVSMRVLYCGGVGKRSESSTKVTGCFAAFAAFAATAQSIKHSLREHDGETSSQIRGERGEWLRTVRLPSRDSKEEVGPMKEEERV